MSSSKRISIVIKLDDILFGHTLGLIKACCAATAYSGINMYMQTTDGLSQVWLEAKCKHVHIRNQFSLSSLRCNL